MKAPEEWTEEIKRWGEQFFVCHLGDQGSLREITWVISMVQREAYLEGKRDQSRILRRKRRRILVTSGWTRRAKRGK